jgi:anthraniloyl-CoA monooxygenase
MRIAVVGGGPGGLYFAALARRAQPGAQLTLWERNAPLDTFGFGVVFSDETLDTLRRTDPSLFTAMERHFARWDDIDVHYRDEVLTSGGHGFAAMGRRELLAVLQQRCAELGVHPEFSTEAPDPDRLAAEYDLVVAADGLNSAVRNRWAATFRPELTQGRSVYIWLGTDLVLDAFTFRIIDTPHGVMQLHGYPYSRTASTLIVEMHEEVWQRAFAPIAAEPAEPGRSDDKSLAALRELLAELLDGHRLLGNASKWIRFTTVRNAAWRHGTTVLLGDAAHTAHFSIGSGTKLALEDAQALAARLPADPAELPEALAGYEAERRPVVESTQRAAQASLEWFEDLARYTTQPPVRFAFNLLSRSRRITYDNLRLRDPEFTAEVNEWFARSEGADAGSADEAGQDPASRPPMFQPYRLAGLHLKNRVLVSAMDMYSATDGLPGDFHLVHLGSRALGGAGLVMTEMVCVSPQGRITPGCAGLWNDAQEAAWTRIAGFVHESSTARIGMQLGHSGRKGSTRLMWEGIDQPLVQPAANWPLVAPSALPYGPANQTPSALGRAGMREIREQFAAAARRCARAGFDLLELHCAHGYLLSEFLSPLTNLRTDGYGGSPAARLRYPLEVLDAVRQEFGGALSVRISATDWHPGGVEGEEGIAMAAALAAGGADAVSVSTGQVVREERPAYGRSYQTPFADRIRNTVGAQSGITVIAAGNISSYDDVNSILLAGRADLCALGRPHLYNPNWTLHAAAEQEYAGESAQWPAPYRAGSRKPRTGKDASGSAAGSVSVSASTRHQRWHPGPPRATPPLRQTPPSQ